MYSAISVDGPWTTRCEYTDPLPQNTKVVSIEAIAWTEYCGSDSLVNFKQNWSDHCAKRKLDKIKSVAGTLDFVAQTPTAASFGLFQTMYDEMVSKNLRVVPDATHPDQTSQNPKYLFDRPAYLAIGGGSIQIGTKIDTDHFATVMGSTSVCDAQDFTYPATLDSQSQYEQYLGYAFQGYNCGFRDKSGHTYGVSVIANSKAFAPVQILALFP
jgi:hypothetical protein